MRKIWLLVFLLTGFPVFAQDLDLLIQKELDSLEALYKHFHSNPELSFFEVKTSQRVADELRKAGYEVTENFGKNRDASLPSRGLVGILRNGQGPTVLVRTDLDALPLEEKTGLPYASKVRTRNEAGEEVPVMHGCGHDMHMTIFIGTARLLAALKNQWKGTLILVGQHAEEKEPGGAIAMLEGGLYERFGKPNCCLALHNHASLPAGTVGVVEGYALASVDSVDITIRGKGGHGAFPHTTKDPIVIASEVVLALQTIVSRENNPLDPAVITVGSIHGGTKHNIIPDEVKLQLTVRSYKEQVRQQLLSSIERITKGIAQAAGVLEDRDPIVTVRPGYPATYNDPALAKRLVKVFETILGKENVVSVDPVMGAEDFSYYSLKDHSIPSVIFWLGTVDPAKVEASNRSGEPLPSLHSPLFAPVPRPTITTGVKAMTGAVLDLMKN